MAKKITLYSWMGDIIYDSSETTIPLAIKEANDNYINLENLEVKNKTINKNIELTNGGYCKNRFIRFKNVHFKFCTIDLCDAIGVEFINCTFQWVALTGMVSPTFCNCVFDKDSSIVDYHMRGFLFQDCRIDSPSMFGSLMDNVRFYDCYIVNQHKKNQVLTNCGFYRTTLSSEIFRHMTLFKTTMEYCKTITGEEIVYPYSIPSEGSFIGWKKALSKKDKSTVLVKLLIPEDAKRTSGTDNKCRCDKAKVLDIIPLGGSYVNYKKAISSYVSKDKQLEYIKGQMVYADYFDEDRWAICSGGIHFFLDKQSAIDY